jgi:AraC-like DNA-binding protein
MQTICPLDVCYLPERPLALRFEFAQAGRIGYGRYAGTMQTIIRRPRHVADDGSPAFHLSFNVQPSSFQYDTGSAQAEWAPGCLALSATAFPAKLQANDTNGFQGLVIPHQLLLERVPHAEALAYTAIPDSTSSRLLRRYIGILSEMNDFSDDAALSDHVETTLLDLAALAISAAGDVAEIAGMRGLRAARVRTIVGEISKSFADSAFSVGELARRLAVSPRYISRLLHETGLSFAERVLELRLQKARAMLSKGSFDHMKVSDIAFACGFGDISYFNRCFRRRFGASPTQYRGGG